MKIKLLAGNKTLNSAVWYTISSIMAKGITVLLTPFFTRILSVSEYGEYTNFISWQNILVVIFSMELSATILRARFDYKDNNIFSGYVFTVSTFGVVFSITVTLLIFACSGFDMENVISIKNHYIWLLIDIIVFAPLLQIFQAEQRSEVKYKVSSVITLVYGICSFLIPYIFTFFLDDKLFALLLGIAANATLWGAGIYFFYFIKPHGAVKTEYIKYALIIAIPVIPHMISNIIMGNSDKLMINSICGAEYAALYGVVYTCALVVNLIRNAINNAWIPWFYKNLDEGNVVKVKNVSKNYLYLFTAASVFLCLTGPEMVMVLGGVKYYTAAKLVPMIMLGCYYNFVNLFYVNIEFYEKKTYMVSVVTVFTALLNVLLNYICIKNWGYIAATYTTAFCNFIIVLLHYFITKKMNNKQICNNKQIFMYCILSAIVFWAITFLYDFTEVRYTFLILFILYNVFYVKKNKNKFNIINGQV